MPFLDVAIIAVYLAAMLGIGFYFLKKNKSQDDYFVGGRSMGSAHIGLSVVATDVGGGFSIGLGGLGFAIGVSGSWMLFTGLIGAWLSAILLIPKVYQMSSKLRLLTFPQIFQHQFGKNVAIAAGIISAIGYMGFTSSQILAGAKLASGTFQSLNLNTAILIMGVVAVVYTTMGGLKAVIYTDTIQWILLITGLFLFGIPYGYSAIGGLDGIKETVGPEFLSLQNISWVQLLNWFVTIVPIWFVGMTLYQRIYASKSKKHAQRAWFIAGLFEYPIMAFLGVLLGLFARVAAENGLFAHIGFTNAHGMDAEMGLPLLLRNVLPSGIMGVLLAAYFSAIMSTADSCLMAASGNINTDLLNIKNNTGNLKISALITLIIGALSLWLATSMQNVLDLMLHSYAFMVAGLFIPIMGVLFFPKKSRHAALVSMIAGGSITLGLTFLFHSLPFGLDPIIFGIFISTICYVVVHLLDKSKKSYSF